MSLVAQRVRTIAPAPTAAVRDQLAVASGQIAAGVGNLAFTLVAAHLLAPGVFGQLAAFLALYLLLGMPASSISAATALGPERAERLRPLLWRGGIGVGVAVALAALWLAGLFRLPVALVVVLACSCPSLGSLALERGRLYGGHRHRVLVTSFFAEPAVRLLLGTAAAALAGAFGAALGVAAGGYAALEIARRTPAARMRAQRAEGFDEIVEDRTIGDLGVLARAGVGAPQAPLRSGSGVARSTALALLLLAVVQNQDLLIANRILSAGQAGQFAVLSTLGGTSVFATMTAPLVLLPRIANGARDGLRPALLTTAAIGGAIVAIVAVDPGALVALLFGARYRDVGDLLTPYLGAMGLLGISRVLAAHRCATGARGSTLVLGALALALQASLILTFGHDTRAVAFSTVTAVSSLTVTLGGAEIARSLGWRDRVRRLLVRLREPVPLAVTLACTAGFGLRMVVPRGLWLDEATSVYEARMGYAAMLHTLRTTDVHPPLYFSVLWLFVHTLGDGALVVRLPSIFAGTLLIPMLYLLGREAYDRRTGAVAALAGSVAPILVWYSQEARMYAMLALFGTIAMWAQVRVLRGRGNASTWVVFTLASAAIGWTQYFGLLQVVVQQLVFCWWLWTRWCRGEDVGQQMRRWAVSSAVVLVCLLPLAPFAYDQFIVNQTAGKGFGAPSQTASATAISGNHLTVYSALANLIWAIWGYQPNSAMLLIAAMWPLGMLFALALLGRRHRRVTTVLAAAVVVPGVAMYVLGLAKQNLFDIRYLSTTVPILFVLIARVLTGIPRRLGLIGIVSALFAATLLVGLFDQQYNGSNPRLYDFSGALASVEAHSHRGDVVYYDPSDLNQVVLYYVPGLRLVPLTAHPAPPCDGQPEFVVVSRSLMNATTNGTTLARALASLQLHGHKVAVRHFPNVETWEFR